jgi:hypothetical protein
MGAGCNGENQSVLGAQVPQSSRSGRLITVPRAVFVLVVVAAMVVGYYGLSLYVPTKPGLGAEPWDLLYYDLQLFTLSSDALQQGPPYNPWLEFARYLLPILAFSAVSAVIARMLNASLQRLARNHVIVVGKGAEANTIAAVLHGQSPRRGALRRGRNVFLIPSGDVRSLRSAGIARASRLVVCGFDTGDTAAREWRDDDDSAANLTAANVAVQLRRYRPGLTVHILVRDADLALALRARRLVKTDNHDHPVHVFTMDELAARQHMRTATFDVETPHLLVVGGTTFGRAIIVEYALRRRREGQHLPPVPVTLIDDHAEMIVDALHERFPFVKRTLTLTPVRQTTATALRQLDKPPTRMYFCSEDEALALGGALAAAGHWRPTQRSIVVRLNRLRAQSQSFSDGAELFDDLGHALDFVTVPESATQELEVFEDPMLELARNIHERFLYDSVNRGRAMGSAPAMVLWEELTEELQRSNLSQARDFPAKLAMIRATVAPRNQLIPDFVFTEDEVELLAIAEHTRWSNEKMANNWSYGDPRDDRRKKHPLLVAWNKLGKDGRDENRDIVREVPLEFDAILELQGMQIIRLSPDPNPPPVERILDDELTPAQAEDLAKAIHAAYLRDNPTGTGGASADWDSLADTFRDANRAQARDIGRKLALIKTFVSRSRPAEGFEFRDVELEMLAQYEHRRWMTERAADGWRLGPDRDNSLKIHPDMRPWADLSETTQDKDRRAILNIPDLLTAVGLHIVRRPPVDR